MHVVDRKLLEGLAATRPSPPRDEHRFDPGHNGRNKEFDLADWVQEHGISVKREGAWGNGGYRYVLDKCPWHEHTDNSAYIVRFANGAIAAGCHHNSCQDYEWRDFRESYEPGAYERNGHQESKNDAMPENLFIPEPPPWPTLAEEAYYGLAGDIVWAIEPYTEADPVALLVNLLAAFGNAVGRGAYYPVGADKHHLKINPVLVGETSKGRKGTSWGYPKRFMHTVDPGWVEHRVANGLSSGEGLIYAVRDRVAIMGKDGKENVKDEGISDKRLLVMEGEFASMLKVMSREGNTLSPVVRQAYDDEILQTMTKNSPMKAKETHISIIAHITKPELLRYLTATETANGFANRFIYLMVKRSKELPFGGGSFADTDGLARQLKEAIEFARSAGEIAWGGSAKDTWREVYGPLSEGKPGLFGAVVGRAEAQTVRLAALYAVLDLSKNIEFEHLAAALALWDYCEASVRYIFGDATGDPVADRIAGALRATGKAGMSRTEIRDLFKRHKNADQIDRALVLLLNLGRVRRVLKDTGGRPSERWFSK